MRNTNPSGGQRQRPIHWLGLAALSLIISGCGFQLRGAVDLPPAISPLWVQGLDRHDELREDLESLLTDGSVILAQTAKEAAAVLRISEYKRSQRVLSVDSRGKAAETELTESLNFMLRDSAGTILVPAQPLSVERNYINSNEQVLGKQFEANMLREEMRRDLARRILNRLNAVLN